MVKVSVGIPTIGRNETLATVLTSVAFQGDYVAEVILLDEGPRHSTENYAVRHALDYLSIIGVDVRIIRNRNPKGIAAARYELAKVAAHDWLMMVDDDVVLLPKCLQRLVAAMMDRDPGCPWFVPTCLLIPDADKDGYTSRPVSIHSDDVRLWVQKYPWFLPYFRYTEILVQGLSCAGTQAILVHRNKMLKACVNLPSIGTLPREDTLITTWMGAGLFISSAECVHYEHTGVDGRDLWSRSVYYKMYSAAMKDPDLFAKLFGGNHAD